ncbi:MAG: hypothetical protein IJG75_01425 [Spirochaetia bacterium]|nr:hypothetical protein [Spirochaetia bacterium]MBR0319168.1 hypothetical protein [Spirochaetia bacterium]
MEREDYIVRRRKKLESLKGKYNPAPQLCDVKPHDYVGMSFADKLISMEDDGIASIIELNDLELGTDTVIDFSDGIYEINSSVYQNANSPADDELRRLIADAMGPATPDSATAQPETVNAPESSESPVPLDRIGMVKELSALLDGTGSPYAAIIAKTDSSFTDVFAPGFACPAGSVFNFPADGDVYSQIIAMRRILIVNSSFCELTELSGLIPEQHLSHIASCCFAPLGSEPDGRYLFFAFDSAVITLDNVKKIIKIINNIPVSA